MVGSRQREGSSRRHMKQEPDKDEEFVQSRVGTMSSVSCKARTHVGFSGWHFAQLIATVPT